MKTQLFRKPVTGFLSIIAIGAISLATITITDNDKAKATVNQVEGLYIFNDSKPVKEYQFLGNIKIRGVVKSVKYEFIREKMIKEAKKKYPDLEGLIFSDDSFEADAIKFKD